MQEKETRQVERTKSDRAGKGSKKVTLKDIARDAGVSVAAVSLILNDKPCRISEENKQLVKRIAKERRYVVNQAARALVTKKSNTLALVLPDIKNHFFAHLAQKLENLCRARGYDLMFANTDDVFENEQKLLTRLAARGVDGIFVIPSNESYLHQEEYEKHLLGLDVPYVMLDRTFPSWNSNQVIYDNFQGGYEGAKHLLECGHRKIACVYTEDHGGNGTLRLNGFKKAMEEAGVLIKDEYLIDGDNRFEGGYTAAEKIYRSDVTAAFITNEMMTLGFLNKSHELKKQIPQDCSVVSYDDSLKEYLFGVELTTIAQDLDQMAKEAATLMLHRLEGRKKYREQVILQPNLIVRKSVQSNVKENV